MLAPAVVFLAAVLLADYLSPITAVIIAVLLLIAGAAVVRDRTEPVPEPDVQEGMPAAALDGISDAVLLLDEDRTVVAANRAARELLDDRVEGRDLALSMRHPEALEAANDSYISVRSVDSIQWGTYRADSDQPTDSALASKTACRWRAACKSCEG